MKIDVMPVALACILIAGCSALEPVPVSDARLPANITKPRPAQTEPISAHQAEDLSLRALLAFYQSSQKLSASELTKLRSALAARPQDAFLQVQQAILYGNDRGAAELGRALGLLESVQKSDEANAVALQPLARLLTDQYAERLKQGAQIDKLGQLARDSQKRADQLQEKLDALAAIERSLPTRPVTPLPPISPEKNQ